MLVIFNLSLTLLSETSTEIAYILKSAALTLSEQHLVEELGTVSYLATTRGAQSKMSTCFVFNLLQVSQVFNFQVRFW